jgi:GMP synthase (glutamine-hydrolysing)
MKTALALRHLAFEDLGGLAPVLEEAGYAIHYLEMGVAPLAMIPPLAADLVIVLGGPVTTYELDAYPWLAEEIGWIRARLLEDQPTLGICLGAQLMAAALGARVYPGARKELGWRPVQATVQAAAVPGLADYLEGAGAVMHWHGDTFDLPRWARRLASSALTANQAFGWGKQCLGIQFHPEFEPAQLERWLIGNALEIAQTEGVTPAALRADTARYGARAGEAAGRFFTRWIGSLADKPGAAKTYSLKVAPPRCLRHF